MNNSVARRRWLPRFSLRTFLVLIALFGVVLGCLGRFWRGVQHQRGVVAKLESAGGSIAYDYHLGFRDDLEELEREALLVSHTTNDEGFEERTFVTESGEITEVETPPGPKFLRDWLGNDIFSDVEMVSFWLEDPPEDLDPHLLLELPELKVVTLSEHQVCDQWLDCVVEIPELQGLALYGGENGPSHVSLEKLQSLKNLRSVLLAGEWVTDEDVATISRLPNLESLSVLSPNITSSSLASIGQLTALRQLDLAGVEQLGDDGTEHLGKLTKLQHLTLLRTSVSDDTLAHLEGLSELRKINLRATHVGDAGMEHLASLRELRSLDIAGTHVGDTGMEHLASLRELRRLDVAGTRVTDAGLAPLSRLPKLRYLSVHGLDISDEGARVLASMKQLYWLEAGQTLITDAGMKELKNLASLKQLTVGPDVTQAAVFEFRLALPDCHVFLSSNKRKEPATREQ